MAICLFWSNYNEIFNCYDECPMKSKKNKKDVCIFQEHLKNTRLFYIDEEY